MDQELNELKRRWTTSRTLEDRLTYVRALARVEGRDPDWIGARLDLERYSPEALRTRVSEHYRAEPKGTNPARAHALDVVVRETAGSWFSGLSELWNPAWCSCHCLPKGPEEIDEKVAKVVDQVAAVYRYHQRLLELGEAPPQEADPVDEARALGEATIDAVIQATRCNESWYTEVPDALAFVLLGRGLPELELEALEALVEVSFSSWTEPSAEARSEALDLYALNAAEAGLRGAS